MIPNEKIELIDSHCHLCFDKFVKIQPNINPQQYQVTEILHRAQNEGISHILTIGTEITDADETEFIVSKHSNVSRTIGIHPMGSHDHLTKYSKDHIQNFFKTHLSGTNKAIGIGEIGLDYYYSTKHKKEQLELFDLQMDIAEQYKLPVCIHSRDAEEDTIAMLKKYHNVNGIIHCFTGSKDFAFQALELGYYVSFSGIITFPKTIDLQNIASNIPKNRLLIETDAPFLAPIPNRGHINEPSFLIHTAQKLANLQKISIYEIANITSNNFKQLFNQHND